MLLCIVAAAVATGRREYTKKRFKVRVQKQSNIQSFFRLLVSRHSVETIQRDAILV